MQRGLHSNFQERLGHSLQFPGVSNSERPLGLGHWTLAYQFKTR
jgi:hypothetical protein